MSLPEEIRIQIAEGIKTAKEEIANAKSVIDDLAISGIDATVQREQLREAEHKLANLQTFYTRQSKGK